MQELAGFLPVGRAALARLSDEVDLIVFLELRRDEPCLDLVEDRLHPAPREPLEAAQHGFAPERAHRRLGDRR